MLHVVTGAPCSGKSTYVAEHRSEDDVVIDLDAIAVALGSRDPHGHGKHVREAAMAARQAAIGYARKTGADAWIIHTNPDDAQRRAYGDAQFHDMDATMEECLERAQRDGRPPGTAEAIANHFGKSAPTGAFFAPDSKAITGAKRPDRTPSRPAGERRASAALAAPQGAISARRGRKEAVMAEETQAEDVRQEPQGETEDPKPQTDWKAEARKWEARAKKSEAAEAELDALKQAQMSEQEKATARAEKAEAELAEVKAEQQRIADARAIAEREGVPSELLEFCADAEAMEAFAARYKAANPPQQVHAAPKSQGSRIVRDAEPAPSNAQRFAQFVEPMFKH